jgi:hypothetical protein
MAREARARRWVVEQGALATRQIRRSAKTRRETLAAALMLQASSTIVFLAI